MLFSSQKSSLYPVIKWDSECGRVSDIKTQATGHSLTKIVLYVCLLYCVSFRFVATTVFPWRLRQHLFLIDVGN